ncbi:hypothetical protein BOM_1518 (plasmid) [Borrelia miyamotoi FR64b]|uniref:Uncharacterized protein n=1 Tax=Borrelia miyamotoi FR64b TaxID=1292392 RepID=W5SLT7_9SPIR|nr:hypothetical protein BOM_1094 [Borrelia miyamotoi FR64b]AHH06061.1 hypothetical protein BOM_1518 [Borrelia miyamotoi FR64b]
MKDKNIYEDINILSDSRYVKGEFSVKGDSLIFYKRVFKNNYF